MRFLYLDFCNYLDDFFHVILLVLRFEGFDNHSVPR